MLMHLIECRGQSVHEIVQSVVELDWAVRRAECQDVVYPVLLGIQLESMQSTEH